MKFSTRVDTDLKADTLFTAISDFARIERLLMRRGVEIAAIDREQDPDVGTAWRVGFDWRGRRRDLRLDLAGFDRPARLSIFGASEPFEVTVEMTVVALSRDRARVIFETDMRPRNMRARLMLQTAKLGKSQLDERFKQKIQGFLRELIAGSAIG